MVAGSVFFYKMMAANSQADKTSRPELLSQGSTVESGQGGPPPIPEESGEALLGPPAGPAGIAELTWGAG